MRKQGCSDAPAKAETTLSEAWIPGLKHAQRMEVGGQAEVYRAIDQEGRWVAAKVLRPEARFDRASGKRMRLEARLLRQFEHPGILPLYREGVLPDGRPYLITPWVEGQSLRMLPQSLRPGSLASFFVDVIDAVAHAHQRGILHRDLHPRNLIMTESMRGCVLDFGIAKSLRLGLRESETHEGELLSVDRYTAPELKRLGSKHATAASDVYSFGEILSEHRKSYESLGLPQELDRLLGFATAELPRDRYRDAGELLVAFQAWRNRQAVPAPERRGNSRRSVYAAAPLLLGLLGAWMLSPMVGAPGSEGFQSASFSLVEGSLPVDASAAQDAPVNLAEWHKIEAEVTGLHRRNAASEPNDSPAQRRADCRRLASAVTDLDPWVRDGLDFRDVLLYRIRHAEIDARTEYVAPQSAAPQRDGMGDSEQVRMIVPGNSGFLLRDLSSQELQVLRAQRDAPLQRIIAASGSSRYALEAEFFALLQEARLPKRTQDAGESSPRMGWAYAESARFRRILDRMEAKGSDPAVIQLGLARQSMQSFWAATRAGHFDYLFETEVRVRQLESRLDAYPDQRFLELIQIRAELVELQAQLVQMQPKRK